MRALLPAARRCLEWVVAQSASTGWLRYVDETGRGLANQGWKDSVDSVQYADGRLAEPPIALCEVQGYAHEAAVAGGCAARRVRGAAGRRAARRGRPTCGERFRARRSG